MNWYSIFYWLSVGDNITTAAGVVSIISGVAFIIFSIAVFCGGFGESYNEEDRKDKAATLPLARKMRNWCLFTFFFLGTVSIFTPSKKDMILIIAGGAVGNFITNDSSAKALPSDVTRYLHNAIQEEMSDLSDHKEDLADKAKTMTKEELLDQIQKGNIVLKKD